MSLPRNPALKLASALLLMAALLVTTTGCTADASRDTARLPAGAAASPGAGVATSSPAQPEAQPAPTPTPAPDPAAELGLKAATVVRVVDGDTAVFAIAGGATEKVRFIGVDTPESTTLTEPYGAEASAYTKRVLKQGRRVLLQTDAELRDKYGRMLAYVWLSAPTSVGDDGRPSFDQAMGRMFNAHLMRDGYAQVMTIPPNILYQDYFLDLQREARADDRGLWKLGAGGDSSGGASAQPPAPATAPPAATGGPGQRYIGNRNTMKFHYPNCSSVGQMNPANKVSLASRNAAISGGYVPCKRCNP